MPARIITAILISSAGFAAALGALPARPSPEHDVTSQELVFQVPGMDRVTVRKDVPFKKTESGELKLDLYFPRLTSESRGTPRRASRRPSPSAPTGRSTSTTSPVVTPSRAIPKRPSCFSSAPSLRASATASS
jgi:hypothetical protein